MNKRGGMFTLWSIVLAIVIPGLILVLIGNIHHAGASHYGGNTDPTAFDKYKNYTTEITTNVTAAKTQVDNDDLTPVGFFTKGTIAGAKQLAGTGNTMIKLIRDLGQDITGFPAEVIDAFALLITVGLFAIIIALVFRSGGGIF